jgi:hypothetical protein
MILKGYFSGRCPNKSSISADLKKPRLMDVSLLEGRKLSLEMYGRLLQTELESQMFFSYLSELEKLY